MERQKKNVTYGKKNESVPIAEYEKTFHVKVIQVGLVVLQCQPWLSATPDGFVLENGAITKILEIKCPISCEKEPIFDKTANKFNVPYLKKINDVDQLNPTHKYYTQCQIQMYVTGLSSCDFYVWSPRGSFSIIVERNEQFLENIILILESFYFKYFLKKLYQKKK